MKNLLSSTKPFSKTSILILIFCFAISCSEEKETVQKGLLTIRLAEAYPNRSAVKTSDFATSIEYIPLETGEETFYKSLNIKSTLGDTALLIKSSDRISIFDREGNYIKDIGHKGEDPEGFGNALRDLGVNPMKNTVYARGKRFDLYEYAISDGKLVDVIPSPDTPALKESTTSTSFFDMSLIVSYGIIQNQYVVGYMLNISGNEPLRLIIYDFEGNQVKTYANNESYEKNPNMIRIESADFHNYKDQLFFKERYNDTLFQVSLDTLEAAIYYDLDKYSPPYSEQESLTIEDRNELMFIQNNFQNDDFVFFNVRIKEELLAGYFNKKTGETFLSEAPGILEKSGFTNDIDDFIPFYPTFINEEGELIGITSAEEVAEWFLDNPDKIASLPKNLQNLQNIDPEDNPVVMIAKPKK